MIISDHGILSILSEDFDEYEKAPVVEQGRSIILIHYRPDELGPEAELIAYDGGDAAILADEGCLFEEVEEFLYPYPDGWYVIEGFRANFCENSGDITPTIENVRSATGKDLVQFRICSPWQGLKYDLNEARIMLIHLALGLKRRLF